MNTVIEKTLQHQLNRVVDQKKIFGTSFAIMKSNYQWMGASGNLSVDQPYFIASTTKLYTTALILKLRGEGKLALNDNLNKYIEASTIQGLHRYKSQDYSARITIKHLLAHTSGLPDYFQDKAQNGNSLVAELFEGRDQFLSFDQIIERTKSITPLFAPGTPNRAHYSDSNFQLLGKIIESITGRSFQENCTELIIKPLGLTSTYLYSDETDHKPMSLYYKSNKLIIPKAMKSTGPDGGMVSTSADMLQFLHAFFNGRLFPAAYIDELQVWNKIFFPFRSGIGIHLFKLPWYFNPTGAVPYFIGHSGLSGALAYYAPREQIYIAGTVNQLAHPDISFRTMIKLTLCALKK